MQDNRNNKQFIIRNLFLLFAIILASVLLIRGLTSGETLSDAADNNNFPIYSTE